MSWMQKLYETYENCSSMIGKIESDNKIPLLPIYHTTQKAHIEIVIDGEGNFKRAKVVPKDQARTIIPCTESSGGRTSGESAHPLCDKLQYVAADYNKFSGGESYFIAKISKNDLKTCGKEADLEPLMVELRQNSYLDNDGTIQEEFGRLAKFDELCINKSREKKKEKIYKILYEKNNNTFNRLLDDWCKSKYIHPKAMAVFKYIQKGNVIKDLVDHKILYVGRDGKLLNKRDGKKQNKEQIDIFDLLPGRENKKKGIFENWQADAFVRWVVEKEGEECSKTWEDKELWTKWINYYSNSKSQKGLCYVTGEERPYAEQHPAKLRSDGDKAKIISSNDWDGFTFRGRFTDTKDDNTYQACGVGFDVTQKVHSALRWLISRQGKVFYIKGDGGRKQPGLSIVAWASSGKPIPSITEDSLSVIGFDDLPSDEPIVVSTAQDVAIRFKHRMIGYASQLGNTDSIIVMGLNSASKGRLAITYYREDLTGSDFLNKIENWHKTCEWVHEYRYKDIQDKETKKNNRFFQPFIGAPAPIDIAEAAYGTKADDKLKNATVERILPCIIEDRQIPKDILESVAKRACKRVSMKEWEWKKALSIACALYKKYNKREVYSMSLEPNRNTRDYLFGRLLAAADCMERFALFLSEKNRDTNAARLMQRFSDRPCSTWKTIELSLVPYKARLGGRAKKYSDVIDEVHNLFISPEDYASDKPLSCEFLLGYHCQREKLKPKKGELKDINETVDDNEQN